MRVLLEWAPKAEAPGRAGSLEESAATEAEAAAEAHCCRRVELKPAST